MEPPARGGTLPQGESPGSPEAVVRGRLVYAGGGSLETLCRSVMGAGELGFFAMRADGTIVFVNSALGRLIGRSPAECIGRNVVEWIHPDQFERAAYLLNVAVAERSPPGMTRFSVLHAGGDYIPIEAAGTTAWDGSDRLIAVYCRDGAPRLAIEEVMELLLKGTPLSGVLAGVCNVIEWNGYGSHVAISWHDGRGYQQVSTGIPHDLGGGDGVAGTPWEVARTTRESQLLTAAELDDRRQALALAHGLAELWVVPVNWHPAEPPATITIWTVGGGRSPQIHGYGLEVARHMVELSLRWADQQKALERAAQLDSLTGLANRRVFFDSLAASSDGGAILYCDLDRFKPVNDVHGHSAGDEVFRAVAERLASCVRTKDVVARIGGDEFTVLCRGASVEDAREVAARIESAFAEPFLLEGSGVLVGISIGIAHSPGPLDEALLEAADKALSEAKASGRSAIRMAE